MRRVRFLSILAMLALSGCDQAIVAASDLGTRAVLYVVDDETKDTGSSAPDNPPAGSGPLVTESDAATTAPTKGYNPLDPEESNP